MHSNRTAKRRGAPSRPKRHARGVPPRNPLQRESRGFEGLIPAGGYEDFFFSGFISDPEEAAEILEHGESREKFDSNPRLGVTVSAGLHFLIVLFLLIEPSLELLGVRDSREEAAESEQEDSLMVFMEEPKPEPPPVTLVPVVPAPAPPTPPAAEDKPPQVADERMLIPKAMLPSPKPQDFMNDLPFSEGKTEEFYTDEEVKDPGKEGETETPEKPEEEPVMAAESGEDGAFTDIRRFLAGARFENPEGGLVANTDNTLYYNDKGANFVPWIRRMFAEVRRNWFVPMSISFEHGHVAVGISVARDGTITDMRLLIPSGTSGFDNAAVGALRASQLMPLPADYPDEKFDIILVFWYNERPYDLFG